MFRRCRRRRLPRLSLTAPALCPPRENKGKTRFYPVSKFPSPQLPHAHLLPLTVTLFQDRMWKLEEDNSVLYPFSPPRTQTPSAASKAGLSAIVTDLSAAMARHIPGTPLQHGNDSYHKQLAVG